MDRISRFGHQPNVLPPTFDDLPATERDGVEHRARRLAGERGDPTPPEFTQTYCCCNCEAPIAKEMVRGELLPLRGFGSTQRRFTALCAHCNLLQEVDTELRDGLWRAIAAPRIVLGEAARKKYFGSIRILLAPYRGRRAC